jgi:hypothetical protein
MMALIDAWKPENSICKMVLIPENSICKMVLIKNILDLLHATFFFSFLP